MSTILTIGYEGSTIEDFVATLKLADVQVLIDIRDVPVSRKRGFSKKALAATLESAGVEYVHLRELGDPKPGREAARRGNMEAFERIFRAHLKGREAQEALEKALDLSSDVCACLLCYERDHSGLPPHYRGGGNGESRRNSNTSPRRKAWTLWRNVRRRLQK